MYTTTLYHYCVYTADREVQRILLELLNQMDGFDQTVNVKVMYMYVCLSYFMAKGCVLVINAHYTPFRRQSIPERRYFVRVPDIVLCVCVCVCVCAGDNGHEPARHTGPSPDPAGSVGPQD